MKKGQHLAKKNGIGNVFRCSGGCVHVNMYGVSLNFNELSFLKFSNMVQEASSKMLDEGLKVLLEDEGKKDFE